MANKIFKYTVEDLNKFILNFLSTLTGVLLALLINYLVGNSVKNSTYKSQLKSINLEAINNKDILENSFNENNLSDKGIVYRSFDVKNAENYLNNEIFLSKAPDSLIIKLSNYIACLKRTNLFREADTKYKYDSLLKIKWGHTINNDLWDSMLKLDFLSISEVLEY